MIGFVDRTASEPTPEERFERLVDLPPSAKLVYAVLDHESPLTQEQLCDRTWLSPRTTRYALSRLKDADLVTEEVYIPDARRKLYASQRVRKPRR